MRGCTSGSLIRREALETGIRSAAPAVESTGLWRPGALNSGRADAADASAQDDMEGAASEKEACKAGGNAGMTQAVWLEQGGTHAVWL